MNKSNKFSPEVRERAVRMGRSTEGNTRRCGRPWSRSRRRSAAFRRRCWNGSSAKRSMPVREAGPQPRRSATGAAVETARWR